MSCSTCKAPIFFVTLARTRSLMPLDLAPNAEGTVLWPWGVDFTDPEPLALGKVLTKKERVLFYNNGKVYTTHWETCPSAATHRKRKQSKNPPAKGKTGS